MLLLPLFSKSNQDNFEDWQAEDQHELLRKHLAGLDCFFVSGVCFQGSWGTLSKRDVKYLLNDHTLHGNHSHSQQSNDAVSFVRVTEALGTLRKPPFHGSISRHPRSWPSCQRSNKAFWEKSIQTQPHSDVSCIPEILTNRFLLCFRSKIHPSALLV